MNSTDRFQLNEPMVIQEIIDGEAIIADLGRGFYYSLDPLGSLVWKAVVAGHSAAEISAACAAAHASPDEATLAGVTALFERLLDEELIVARDGGMEALDLAALLSSSEGPFKAPELFKYTDMEQLLLLDPIHEVDETGWPKEAKDYEPV